MVQRAVWAKSCARCDRLCSANRSITRRPHHQSHEGPLLCATSVSLWCVFARNSSTTETQRTQRLHREIHNVGTFFQSLCSTVALCYWFLSRNCFRTNASLCFSSRAP